MGATAKIQIPDEYLIPVFGELDKHLHKVERVLHVTVVNRNGGLSIHGKADNVQMAVKAFDYLLGTVTAGEYIDDQTINYMLDSLVGHLLVDGKKLSHDVVCVTSTGKPIKPKTMGQADYVRLIKENTIVFGAGPAGTGKTFLAMASAIAAFRRGEVTKIILTRPAIEAGEHLGFLPGDMQEKVDPYLRPLYDALHDIMGLETFLKHVDKGAIEVAPLAYMRGRTLENAFIILDEAQNTTKEQMRMFLTRLGFGSKMVVTGDITQIDLPGKNSGMVEALQVLTDIDSVKSAYLTGADVVRHPLIQKIIASYEKHRSE